MKVLKYNPEEIDVEITDISLLTIEEAKQLPENIREYEYGSWWWLRDPGYDCYAALVCYDGFVDDFGDIVGLSDYVVRPAITISNVTFNIGDVIIIQNKKYVAIAHNKVLYNDKLVYHRFDKSTNDYEKSEIKEIVNRWLEGEENHD